MLELRRLRLLRELHERGTIAAVADALQFTPSAVSQQLAMLEREAGVKLIEKAGRGVRLTDPGLVLAEHADALLERAALAEADLAAAANEIAGRGRIAAFQSAAFKLALPAIAELRTTAPRLRCELIEAEPEHALPMLALGDLDVVLGDEWDHHPWRLQDNLTRHPLLRDPLMLVGSDRPLEELYDAHWAAGHPGMSWEESLRRVCREHGGFDPDIRHRSNDANVALALAARGLAVTLLPRLVLPPGTPATPVPFSRTIYAVIRTTDERRPSTRALLAAVRDQLPAS
ncbi:LysR family transcriptional regulator [Solirubrobacter sp. CPCC 204708]|uniref:LysR family transcriptional regulator n=1 Tax=Solirubrobacter deserti TaxID=2282478 RepID=A0ABT4RE55_9ACTN|nr:LysR family transcriptional regulator [Solirubrobacter deserti]MBE2316053.1 LysR family transcriptional regulator [Solirubrobacter deserti]MDA0136805.1 LysR family transcriptional regulator [Solirubrobacter deserti]